jgi:hypothetical protein
MTPARIALWALVATACAGTLPPIEGGEGSEMLPASHLELTTADGEVLGVDRRDPAYELSEGLRVELRNDARQPVVVRLAPGWYLDERGIAYGPRERLTVRGRREVRQGSSEIVVTEVRQNGRWVPLRDSAGRPLWRETDQPR